MVSRRLSIVPILLLAASACASSGPAVPPWAYGPRPMADTLPIWEPEERQDIFMYDIAYQALFRPVAGGGSDDTPTWNVDPFDDVVNSTWFTHRIDTGLVTPENLRAGPTEVDGPDQSGPVTVWSVKKEGLTPGFWIEDARGTRWIVKFDPPEHVEMASGAEIVSTHLLWAAGYNVPENHIVYLDPDRLVLDPSLDTTREAFERDILDLYPRRNDGTIRALASRFLDGVPKGPFDYEGTRDDDPNDVIPHQHRRELRGLYVLAAWLNHVDARQGNTLDMFIPHEGSPAPDGRAYGHLRHHLIDLGATLGSASVFPHNRRHGLENDLDLDAIGKRFLSLGAYERAWEDFPDPEFPPSIGFYSADLFLPGEWRPSFPNPAFDHVTPADGYWGAKIVMAFTDEHLRTAVGLGDYSDPRAEEYLLDGLRGRRDASGRYWFGRVTPLEEAAIDGREVVFEDLWVHHFGGRSEYRYAFDDGDREVSGVVGSPRIPLPDPLLADGEGRTRLRVWRRAPGEEWTPRPARFWIARDPAGDLAIIGARY